MVRKVVRRHRIHMQEEPRVDILRAALFLHVDQAVFDEVHIEVAANLRLSARESGPIFLRRHPGRRLVHLHVDFSHPLVPVFALLLHHELTGPDYSDSIVRKRNFRQTRPAGSPAVPIGPEVEAVETVRFAKVRKVVRRHRIHMQEESRVDILRSALFLQVDQAVFDEVHIEVATNLRLSARKSGQPFARRPARRCVFVPGEHRPDEQDAPDEQGVAHGRRGGGQEPAPRRRTWIPGGRSTPAMVRRRVLRHGHVVSSSRMRLHGASLRRHPGRA